MASNRSADSEQENIAASPFPPSSAPQQDSDQELIAISDRRTLYLVNIFIGSSANFLNSFSSICQDKLADVHRRIMRLDSSLRIIEAKLRGLTESGGDVGGKDGEELGMDGLSSSSSSTTAINISGDLVRGSSNVGTE